jgi:hypothetical protein
MERKLCSLGNSESFTNFISVFKNGFCPSETVKREEIKVFTDVLGKSKRTLNFRAGVKGKRRTKI